MLWCMTMPIEQTDYSVAVKRRAPPPKSWRWEIYRAGKRNPVEQSSVYFQTMAAASRAGKDALNVPIAGLIVSEPSTRTRQSPQYPSLMQDFVLAPLRQIALPTMGQLFAPCQKNLKLI
jgi:hypothetical protein